MTTKLEKPDIEEGGGGKRGRDDNQEQEESKNNSTESRNPKESEEMWDLSSDPEYDPFTRNEFANTRLNKPKRKRRRRRRKGIANRQPFLSEIEEKAKVVTEEDEGAEQEAEDNNKMTLEVESNQQQRISSNKPPKKKKNQNLPPFTLDNWNVLTTKVRKSLRAPKYKVNKDFITWTETGISQPPVNRRCPASPLSAQAKGESIQHFAKSLSLIARNEEVLALAAVKSGRTFIKGGVVEPDIIEPFTPTPKDNEFDNSSPSSFEIRQKLGFKYPIYLPPPKKDLLANNSSTKNLTESFDNSSSSPICKYSQQGMIPENHEIRNATKTNTNNNNSGRSREEIPETSHHPTKSCIQDTKNSASSFDTDNTEENHSKEDSVSPLRDHRQLQTDAVGQSNLDFQDSQKSKNLDSSCAIVDTKNGNNLQQDSGPSSRHCSMDADHEINSTPHPDVSIMRIKTKRARLGLDSTNLKKLNKSNENTDSTNTQQLRLLNNQEQSNPDDDRPINDDNGTITADSESDTNQRLLLSSPSSSSYSPSEALRKSRRSRRFNSKIYNEEFLGNYGSSRANLDDQTRRVIAMLSKKCHGDTNIEDQEDQLPKSYHSETNNGIQDQKQHQKASNISYEEEEREELVIMEERLTNTVHESRSLSFEAGNRSTRNDSYDKEMSPLLDNVKFCSDSEANDGDVDVYESNSLVVLPDSVNTTVDDETQGNSHNYFDGDVTSRNDVKYEINDDSSKSDGENAEFSNSDQMNDDEYEFSDCLTGARQNQERQQRPSSTSSSSVEIRNHFPTTFTVPDECMSEFSSGFGCFTIRNNKLVRLDALPQQAIIEPLENYRQTSQFGTGAFCKIIDTDTGFENQLEGKDGHENSSLASSKNRFLDVQSQQSLSSFEDLQNQVSSSIKSPKGKCQKSALNTPKIVSHCDENLQTPSESVVTRDTGPDQQQRLPTGAVMRNSYHSPLASSKSTNKRICSSTRSGISTSNSTTNSTPSTRSTSFGISTSNSTTNSTPSTRSTSSTPGTGESKSGSGSVSSRQNHSKRLYRPIYYCNRCDFKSRGKSLFSIHVGKHDEQERLKNLPSASSSSASKGYSISTPYTGLESEQEGNSNEDGRYENSTNIDGQTSGKSAFKCGKCSFECDFKASLTLHQRHHDKEEGVLSLPCPFCQHRSRSKAQFLSHITTVHDNDGDGDSNRGEGSNDNNALNVDGSPTEADDGTGGGTLKRTRHDSIGKVDGNNGEERTSKRYDLTEKRDEANERESKREVEVEKVEEIQQMIQDTETQPNDVLTASDSPKESEMTAQPVKKNATKSSPQVVSNMDKEEENKGALQPFLYGSRNVDESARLSEHSRNTGKELFPRNTSATEIYSMNTVAELSIKSTKTAATTKTTTTTTTAEKLPPSTTGTFNAAQMCSLIQSSLRRLSEQKKGKKYRCDVCKWYSYGPSKFAIHMARHEEIFAETMSSSRGGGGSYITGSSTTTTTVTTTAKENCNLFYTADQAFDGERYRCNRCIYSCNTKGSFNLHLRTHQLMQLEEEEGEQQEKDKHSNSSDSSIVCTFCHSKLIHFATKEELAKHLDTVHSHLSEQIKKPNFSQISGEEQGVVKNEVLEGDNNKASEDDLSTNIPESKIYSPNSNSSSPYPNSPSNITNSSSPIINSPPPNIAISYSSQTTTTTTKSPSENNNIAKSSTFVSYSSPFSNPAKNRRYEIAPNGQYACKDCVFTSKYRNSVLRHVKRFPNRKAHSTVVNPKFDYKLKPPPPCQLQAENILIINGTGDENVTETDDIVGLVEEDNFPDIPPKRNTRNRNLIVKRKRFIEMTDEYEAPPRRKPKTDNGSRNLRSLRSTEDDNSFLSEIKETENTGNRNLETSNNSGNVSEPVTEMSRVERVRQIRRRRYEKWKAQRVIKSLKSRNRSARTNNPETSTSTRGEQHHYDASKNQDTMHITKKRSVRRPIVLPSPNKKTPSYLKRNNPRFGFKSKYRCRSCNYCTTTARLLSSHVRYNCTRVNLTDGDTHVEVNPNEVSKCKICGHTSANKFHLRVHMRTHLSERKFNCLHCDYAGMSESHLSLHSKQHTGKGLLFCPLCGYSAFRRDYLKKHMNTKHNLGLMSYKEEKLEASLAPAN